MTNPVSTCKKSRAKMLAYGGILVVVIWLVAELASLVGLWILDGKIDFAANRDALDDVANPAALDLQGEREVNHPYVGWVQNPTYGSSASNLQQTVNEFGFPKSSLPVQTRSKDKLIVAILGGSVAQHVAQDAGERLANDLASSTRFHARKIKVVNLALSGYRQPQQLMVLTYFLALGAEFDFVVNIDGYNEIALYPVEDAQKHLSVAFPRGWYRRNMTIPTGELLELRQQLRSLKSARNRWAACFRESSLPATPLQLLIWRSRDSSYHKAIGATQSAILKANLGEINSYGGTGPPANFVNDEEMYHALVDLWANSSRQLQRLCTVNGILYQHLLQPNQYVEGTKPMSDEEREIAVLESSAYGQAAAKGYPLLQEAGRQLQDEGVRFHDETMLFAQETEPIYSDNCCHYNQDGYDRLAARVAEILANDDRWPRQFD